MHEEITRNTMLALGCVIHSLNDRKQSRT